jgi:hypothetical protein
MAVITRSLTEIIYIVESHTIVAAPNLPFYGTLVKANAYFRFRLDTDAWLNATQDQQIAALVMSTQAIDRLQFIGETPEDQALSFPRDFQDEVPVPIERACYENALKLLDGVDPDTERDNLMKSSQAYGGVRSTIDRSSLAPYYVHGIASPTAWSYLQPYLTDGELLVMKRGS